MLNFSAPILFLLDFSVIFEKRQFKFLSLKKDIILQDVFVLIFDVNIGSFEQFYLRLKNPFRLGPKASF